MRSAGLVLGLSAGSVCSQEAIGSTFSTEERRTGKERKEKGEEKGRGL